MSNSFLVVEACTSGLPNLDESGMDFCPIFTPDVVVYGSLRVAPVGVRFVLLIVGDVAELPT